MLSLSLQIFKEGDSLTAIPGFQEVLHLSPYLHYVNIVTTALASIVAYSMISCIICWHNISWMHGVKILLLILDSNSLYNSYIRYHCKYAFVARRPPVWAMSFLFSLAASLRCIPIHMNDCMRAISAASIRLSFLVFLVSILYLF